MQDRFSKIKADIDTKAAVMKISELKQLQTELANKYQQQLKMNVDFGQIEQTKTQLDQVTQKLAGVQTEANKSGGSGGIFSKMFGGDLIGSIIGKMVAMGAAIFSVQKVMELLKGSVDAFEGREKAMLGVESVIKSMGKESEFTSGGLLSMAEQLQSLNKYSVKVTDILDMQSFLMTFDTMNKQILPQASQAIIDLAAKMKVDLVSAAKSVGIALEDPEGGLNRFRRSGIMFSDEQKDMIKSMVETGDKAGAQAKIFEVLEGKVGGYAKNTTTAFEETKNRLSVFFESIERGVGGLIAGALTPLGQSLVSMVPKDSVAEFDKLSASVKNTNDNILPLIGTYSTLMSKANLNKAEHEKLNSVIKTISDAFPGAITQWDNYGNAIAISTTKLWDLIQAEKERLKYVNQEAIQKTYNDKGTLDYKVQQTQSEITAGGKDVSETRGGRLGGVTTRFHKFSDDEIKDLKNYHDQLVAQRTGIEEEYKRLTGESNGVPDKPKKHTGTGDSGEDSKEKVSMAIEDLKFLDGDYYKYKIGLINDEAEARLKDGQDAVAVEMAKFDKLKELAKEYTDFVDKTFPTKGFVGNEMKTPQQLAASLPKELPIGKDPGNTNSVKETNLQLKAQLALTDSLKHGFNSAGNSLADSMGKAVQVFGQANSLLEQFINNLAESVVKSLALAAINWATGGILGFLGIGGGGASPAGHSGGSFVGTSSGVMKMSGGGSFIVPPGYNRDSFPLMVESGERVSVTPANQVNNYGSNVDMSGVIKSIQILNANMVNQNGRAKNQAIGIEGKLNKGDIYLSNRKATRQYSRFKGGA
jgi:hypothetical protein